MKLHFAYILNFVQAAIRTSRHFVLYRDTVVTPQVRDERLDHCRRCVNHIKGNCRVCGCFVSAKVLLASEKCPIGRWAQTKGELRRTWLIVRSILID
jgi:hypothetical protein